MQALAQVPVQAMALARELAQELTALERVQARELAQVQAQELTALERVQARAQVSALILAALELVHTRVQVSRAPSDNAGWVPSCLFPLDNPNMKPIPQLTGSHVELWLGEHSHEHERGTHGNG